MSQETPTGTSTAQAETTRVCLEFIAQATQRMKAKGINRAELARRLGKTRPYVTKLFQQKGNFTLTTMSAIAQALGMELRVQMEPPQKPIDEPSGSPQQWDEGPDSSWVLSVPIGKPPILDITRRGRLTVSSGWMVLAVMAYPRAQDEVLRRQTVALYEARHITSGEKLRWLSDPARTISHKVARQAYWLLPIACEAPSPEEMGRKLKKDAKQAWVAALILYDMLSVKIKSPEFKVTLSMVYETESQLALAEAAGSPESRMVCEPDTFRRWWERYRSVAHLNLALLQFPHVYKTNQDSSYIFSHGLSKFLSLAEMIRREAVKHGILRATEAWRTPDDLELELCEHSITDVLRKRLSLDDESLAG